MITPNGDFAFETTEKRVVGHDVTRRSHPMENIGEVLQLSTEHLADGLMSKANAQDRFLAGVGADNIAEQACLGRDARTGREHNLGIRFQYSDSGR